MKMNFKAINYLCQARFVVQESLRHADRQDDERDPLMIKHALQGKDRVVMEQPLS